MSPLVLPTPHGGPTPYFRSHFSRYEHQTDPETVLKDHFSTSIPWPLRSTGDRSTTASASRPLAFPKLLVGRLKPYLYSGIATSATGISTETSGRTAVFSMIQL